MKLPITPTSVEKTLRDDEIIVSMTDLKGNITYGNRVFLTLSGYCEDEILGMPHSIVRHPDMPRAIFKLLWDKIQNREECFIYTKDITKDGSFYWVFTNVTPTFDPAGNMTGYFSVRRKPTAGAVQTIGAIYHSMLEAEKKAGPENAIAAATAVLGNLLKEKGVSYDEFILAI